MGLLGRLKTALNITKADLAEQRASPVANSNRDLWSGGKVVGLTPEKLASILERVRRGENPAEYLELATEIEQRDAHYRSVLSTRKHSIEGLEIYIQAGSEDAQGLKIAEAVQEDILNHPDIMDLRKNMLDALGKGFSVNEIMWDTTGLRWKPKEILFRDPRWFAYDKQSGLLCLRDTSGEQLVPLSPYKFIVHEPNLLSGMQITSGLSFTALFYWLIKTYDVTSWAAFADRFGYPVRLGKYGRKATKEDIATLKRAVAAIGSDVGAVIPDAMAIDIIESKTTSSNSEVYEKIAEWVDKQLSKLVLGQTASADGTPGKLGDSQSQEEVRQDILKADIAQAEHTINRDLVIPYVQLNFGEQSLYPRLVIQYTEEKNISLIVDSVAKLTPFGLRVKAEEMRNLLGLTAPDKEDEVLEQPIVYHSAMNGENESHIALNASEVQREKDIKDELLDEAEETDFIEITDDIVAVLEKASYKATDFKSFEKELQKLIVDWDTRKTARLMAISFFKARSHGDSEFEGED